MRIYIIKANTPGSVFRRFSGSQADASSQKTFLRDRYALARGDVSVEEAEIPAGKVGLLDWLNMNATKG